MASVSRTAKTPETEQSINRWDEDGTRQTTGAVRSGPLACVTHMSRGARRTPDAVMHTIESAGPATQGTRALRLDSIFQPVPIPAPVPASPPLRPPTARSGWPSTSTLSLDAAAGDRLFVRLFDGSRSFSRAIRRSRSAWPRPVARPRAARDRLASLTSDRSTARRNAPDEARAAARPGRSPRRRDRHRPAGGPLRRPALHAAQGHHRHPAGRARSPRARRAGGPSLLDRRRGSRLERDRQRARSSTATTRRTVDGGAARRRRRVPVASLPLHGRHLASCSPSWRGLPPTEFTERARATLCASSTRGRAWPTRSAAGSTTSRRRSAWSCSTAPIRRPSHWRPMSSRASSSTRAAPPAGRRGRRRPVVAATTPGRAAEAASRCSTSTAAAHRSRSTRTSSASGDQTSRRAALRRRRDVDPRGVQPERPAAAARAGHALPDHLLRRGPERARVPRAAARRLRALRHADAADLAARDGDPLDSAALRFLTGTRCRSRRCSAQDERRSTSCSRAAAAVGRAARCRTPTPRSRRDGRA